MRVVDAGVIVALLASDLDPDRLGEEELVVPHLLDSEVTNALRLLVLRRALTEEQGRLTLEGFTGLTLSRFPADWLRDRMWQLRHSLSAYDATYVALAEATGASALLTTDARLARAPGLRCRVEVV